MIEARFFLFPNGDANRAPRPVSAWLPVRDALAWLSDWQTQERNPCGPAYIEYRRTA